MKIFPLVCSLGLALAAIYVSPSFSAPVPGSQDCKPQPGSSKNCMLESMGVDSTKLGELLNSILNVTIHMVYSNKNPCQIQQLTKDLQEVMKDLEYFLLHSGDHQTMTGLLQSLLTAVEKLLDGLLGNQGLLGGVADLLNEVINLVICLLNSLGLKLDLNLLVKLGDLLDLDLRALLNLG